MGKLQDEDRCEIYEKRGSRHTRCSQRANMGYQTLDTEGLVNRRKKGEAYELRICYKHIAYEPKDLDTLVLTTSKMVPKKMEDGPSEEVAERSPSSCSNFDSQSRSILCTAFLTSGAATR